VFTGHVYDCTDKPIAFTH